MTMHLCLQGQNLACQRGGRVLFRGLDFTLANGEAASVTGANGVGKTSLLRMIARLLPPAAGQIIWSAQGEQETGEHGADYPLPPCHFIAHQNALKPQLRTRENLAFWAGWFGVSANPAMLDDILQHVGLRGQAEAFAGDLSAGQAKRLALARLFIVPRALWLLDEPLAGLDRQGRDWFTQIAATHLAQGGLIFAATHERFAGTSVNLDLDALGNQHA